MFEKEAEEYTCNLLKDVNCNIGNPRARQINSIDVEDGFKAGAEFGYNKAKEEMQEQGLALQSDMDKTIEQNIQLKKQIEKVTKEELKEQDIRLNRLCFDYQEKEKRIAELEKELEQAKKVQVVEHFEAYGQCRDSRRIASLETENVELKDKLKNLESVAEVRLANWQKYEKGLKEAKDLVRNLLRVTYGEGWNYSLDVKVKAEDFLKEDINEQART